MNHTHDRLLTHYFLDQAEQRGTPQFKEPLEVVIAERLRIDAVRAQDGVHRTIIELHGFLSL